MEIVRKGEKFRVTRILLEKLDYLSVCCSVTQLCPTLHNPTDCSTPGLPGPHHLPEFAQVHVHWAGEAIQPSHPLNSSPAALNLFHHQGLFQWVSCSHQVTKILELQLQHQPFRCILSWFPLRLTGLIYVCNNE